MCSTARFLCIQRAVYCWAELSRSRHESAIPRYFPQSPVHLLLNNAGAMPDQRTTNSAGLETTWATAMGGAHALTAALAPALRAGAPSTVINMTSGGAYTAPLDLQAYNSDTRPYDSTWAYAHAKRAQLCVTQLWAQQLATDGVRVYATHPGWVNTPGLQRSMPSFAAKRQHDLRTPEQGVDTVLWLASRAQLEPPIVPSGSLVFDRAEVSPDKWGAHTAWTAAQAAALQRLNNDAWQGAMPVGATEASAGSAMHGD